MRNAKYLVKQFWYDEEGAAAAEYALILAIVGAAIAAAAIYLGGAIATAMNKAADCITTPVANCLASD